MISNVNFGTSKELYKGLLNEKSNNRAENASIPQKKDGFFRKTVNTVANVQKGYIGIKDGIFGAVSALATGFVTGAAALGINWTVRNLTGKGVKGQTVLTTPLKTAADLAGSFAKKAASLPKKNITQIVTYPFIKFPQEVFNYVKNIQGVSKFGKATAVGLGVAAAGLSAIGTWIGINKSFANVDHGYRVGHNK